QNTVVSTRVSLPSHWLRHPALPVARWNPKWATKVRRPRPFQTRPEKFHGGCVDLPITTSPIWSKPRHDFDYGDLSQFDSGWLRVRTEFAPNPLEWRDDEGEREYSSVSEPTPEEIQRWKKLHT